MKTSKSLPVFYASPVAMSLATTREKKYIDVNQAWLDLFEYGRKQDVIGRTARELELGGDLGLEHLNGYEGKDNITKKIGVNAITKSGKQISVLVTLTHIVLARNEYLLSVVEDISELKRAENALRDSEAKFRRIVEGANEGIWQTNSEMKTVYVNSKMAEMLGYTPAEMLGTSIYEFMDEEGKTLIHKKKSIDNKSKNRYGHKYLRKDGSYLHAIVSETPLFDSTDSFEGTIHMITDISPRIDVEKALKSTRRKLEMALENGKVGTWEWNINTGECKWDERISKLLGLSNNGDFRSISVLEEVIHDDDFSHLREAVARSVKLNQPVETILRTKARKDRPEKYISLKAFINRNKKNSNCILSGVCFDVTAMKKDAEQGLLKLTEELLRSNNDLKQFAYIASHDLQEPLRMVSSFTQLLQHKYSDQIDDDGREYIKYAVEGAKRMYDLLNGLLAYSRVQTRGKEFSKVDMNDVLEKVRSNLSLIIRERGCVVKGPNLPEIIADESQMLQLFQNLIENAIKFSLNKPVISISSTRNNGYHLFSVEDEGIGIEKQYYEKIFRIFQRLNHSDEYHGTGVGLAICKRIVERHNGIIWLKSVPGKGSTFFFTIPCRGI
jgi:PAS domain S-box-containing protein